MNLFSSKVVNIYFTLFLEPDHVKFWPNNSFLMVKSLWWKSTFENIYVYVVNNISTFPC